jgi:hypothetical protein
MWIYHLCVYVRACVRERQRYVFLSYLVQISPDALAVLGGDFVVLSVPVHSDKA